MSTTGSGTISRPNVRRSPSTGFGVSPSTVSNVFASAVAYPSAERRFSETDRLLQQSWTMVERLRQAVAARDTE
jgi:hypothetical protein